MPEVLAAILGALLAGGFRTLVEIFDRRRAREAVLTAIASEVAAICTLVRQQDYRGDIANAIAVMEADLSADIRIIVDLRSDYFSVFHSLSDRLGDLLPSHVERIVKFYMACKTLVDSLRPDGPYAADMARAQRLDNHRHTLSFLDLMLQLGEEISGYPKVPIISREVSA